MIKEFIFCVGLPGCGKSTFLESNYEFVKAPFIEDGNEFGRFVKTVKSYEEKYMLVSADSIKSNLDGYSNEHPENVHELSVKLARQYIYSLIDNDFDVSVILDGGGTFVGIANKVREINNYARLSILVTHLVNDRGLENLSNNFDEVFITNSYKDWNLIDNLPRNVKVIDVV